MSLTEILLTSLIISLFCCGLSIVTGEGMLLYFLRKPFDKLRNKVELLNNWHLVTKHVSATPSFWAEEKRVKIKLNLIHATLYLFKPIILCCTCMASFWGIGIFIVIHGLHVNLIPQMVICCFCSCFLNAFFISKYNQ